MSSAFVAAVDAWVRASTLGSASLAGERTGGRGRVAPANICRSPLPKRSTFDGAM